MSYEAKNPAVSSRQMVVEELAIPFFITHNATPASVGVANDEPQILFIKTEGVDQIAAQLTLLADTASYTGASIVDVNGILTMYVKLDGDVCKKVISAYVVSRITGVQQPVFLGSATGISSVGNIMLKLDSTVNHATTDFDGTLVLKYSVTK